MVDSAEDGWRAALELIQAGQSVSATLRADTRPTLQQWKRRSRQDAGFRAEVQAALGSRSKPRRTYSPTVRADYVAHLHRGLGLLAALQQPGMPDRSTLQKWRRADPVFDAAVRSAVGQQGRAVRGVEPDWSGALAALRVGASLADACPGHPRPTVVQWYWRRRRDAAFREQADAAMRTTRRSGVPVSEAEWDQVLERLTAEAPHHAAVKADATLPSSTCILRKAAAEPAFRSRLDAAWTRQSAVVIRYGAADYARAQRAVSSGVALTRLDPSLPSRSTLWRRRQADRDLDRVVRDAARARGKGFAYTPGDYAAALAARERGQSDAAIRAMGLPGVSAAHRWGKREPAFRARWLAVTGIYRELGLADHHQLHLALSRNEVWAAVNAAVPRGLPAFIRDDVVTEMVADELEGHLGPSEVRRAAAGYVAAYHREAGSWGARSFDAVLGSDGRRTLHDLLPR